MAASYVILNEYNLCTFKGRTFFPGGKSQVRAYFHKGVKASGVCSLPALVNASNLYTQDTNECTGNK